MTRALAVLSALLLCGCGWVQFGDTGQPAESRPEALQPARAAPEEGRIRVERGDSVYLIARRHGVAMRDLIDLNGLTAPFHLREGQMLTLPKPRKHLVVAGDSLWSISRQYDVPLAALVRANGLKSPYTIYKGSTIRIPRRAEPSPKDGAQARAGATPGRAPAASRRSGREGAAGAPPVPSPAPVTQAEAPQRTPSGKSEAGGAVPTPRQAAAPGPTPSSPPAAEAKPAPRTVARPPAAPVQTALKPLPQRVGRFLRPIAGPVVVGFGPQPDGLHNDGINIAAPRGAGVHSAEAGRVAYSGNELPGYGNLLLIRHQGGWVSAYAHNDRLLVGRGDEVRRGQKIALVGSSGRVTTPQLHFELRRQGRAVDPSPHLDGG